MKSKHLSARLASALAPVALAAGVLSSAALAQSNSIPGTDVSLGLLSSLTSFGHEGAFPNGVSGVSLSTTSCNLGSVNVPWLSPMQENHPLIAFLLVREDDSGRMVQISDRSHLKHGFFALSNSQCIPCQNPSNGTFLGVGCSDTYSQFNNSDKYYLGPADEIDPWLGTWENTCSFFDEGLNPTPPFDCDSQRSFTQSQANSLGPVGTRMRVLDSDLDPAGNPTFYYASQYVVLGEPEANRENNIASRSFFPSWTGTKFNFSTTSSRVEGSVLARWTGATIDSNTNGTDDGRVYVATKVTGPVDGVYHYEYAIHNRDNARGVGGFRVPVCSAAGVSNFGFHDIDEDASNDWTVSVQGDELVFETTANTARWNTIFNFWFDSTAAPEAGSVTLDAGSPGAGANSFDVGSAAVPTGQYSSLLGPGCAVSGTPATLDVNGPAVLGGSGFAFETTDASANAVAVLYGSGLAGVQPLAPGCDMYLGGVLGAEIKDYATTITDATGAGSMPLTVPNNPALAGLVVDFQLAIVPVGGGPVFGLAELSDGLRVLVGDPSGCL